jgi:hypothetical protein
VSAPRSGNMRKLRLALLLPGIQFVIAALLLHYGYRTPFPLGPRLLDACWGLNAPAMPVMKMPALLFRLLGAQRGPAFAQWLPRSILGYGIDDLFFLGGVILLWYIAGGALDRRRSRATGRIGIVTALVIYPTLLLLGATLASSKLYDLGPGRITDLDPPLGAFLGLMWSIALIVIAGLGLAMAFRSRKHNKTG